MDFSLVAERRGYCVRARASHCGGSSGCRAAALGCAAAVLAVLEFSSTGSIAVAHRLTAPRHVGSSWIRDQTRVSWFGRHILFHWATREALNSVLLVATARLPSARTLFTFPPTMHKSACFSMSLPALALLISFSFHFIDGHKYYLAFYLNLCSLTGSIITLLLFLATQADCGILGPRTGSNQGPWPWKARLLTPLPPLIP